MGLFSRRKSKSDRSGGSSSQEESKRASRGFPSEPSVPSQPPPAYGSSAFNQGYGGAAADGAGAASSYYETHPQNQQQQPPQQQYLNPGGSAAAPGFAPNRHSFPLPTMNPTVALEDDPYSFLATFDTVLLIDDSGSMSGGRWRQTAQALSSIVGIVTHYDSDGVDVYFLNHPSDPRHRGIRSPETLMALFDQISPRGATPTGQRLNSILKPYLERLKKAPSSIKPLNIIVITDGCPTDDVESVIVQTARKLDNMEADLTQVGIQFFQVGDDRAATEALKELDDALGDMKGVRDIVDTLPWKGQLQGDQMLKVVLGAVNRRLDRKRA